MAKQRTARQEKGVLARQEVVRSRAGRAPLKASPSKRAKAKVPSPRRQQGGGIGQGLGYLRDILAVFSFAAAVGATCALVTYNPRDAVASASKVHNLLGPVGHQVASEIFGFIGICGYLAPIALLYTSVSLFVRERTKSRSRQIFGLAGFALSTAVLAHLLIGRSSFLSYPPGGALGAALGEALRSVLFTFGAVLVMAAAAGGALIIATDSAFTRLCVAIGSLTSRLGITLWGHLLDSGKKQVSAFKEHRIRRAEEKAEEDAAFAQMMADAEIADAEQRYGTLPPHIEGDDASEDEKSAREADEAAMVAEEAAKLAREAEERRLAAIAEEKAREAALKARRRKAPVEDPAWALDGSESDEESEQNTAKEPATPEKAQTKIKTQPVIAMPPSPSSGATAIRATQQIAAEAAPKLAKPKQTAPPPIPASVPAEPIAQVGPVLPVIVEPKAPPAPSKLDKKDPFAFAGTSNFSLPPVNLLEEVESKKRVLDKYAFFATADKLREKLASFGIDGAVKEIRPGPVVTMYEFEPAPGIKISKIANLADDLAMAMEALKVRIVAPIPGKGVVGIEVPNKERETVHFREIVEQDVFTKSPSKLAMAIGKNIEGMPFVTDLAKMPHLLIAGTTGSGKSVSVNAMIMSVLFKATPEEVRMIMVDPKVTELSIYEGIPHLLLPVVTDARKAALALRWAVEEMERRYQLLADAGVRNIAGYNKWAEKHPGGAAVLQKQADPARMRIIDVAAEPTEGAAANGSAAEAQPGVAAPSNFDDELDSQFVAPTGKTESQVSQEADAASVEKQPEPPKKLPYIVIIIDEVADLMMVASREVETYVARLAQMARAAGIHLMIATQRPSTDVITGVIKANFPARISFQLRSKPDSMTILGTVGAEALLGMGDMLILPPTSAHMERVHGAFVSDAEIQKVVSHLKSQGKPVYDESILRPRDDEGEDGDSGSGGGGREEFNDEMYDQCLALVSEMRQISVSMLQRKLRLGYNRAARIIERMEREGIVGPANGSKPRDVLIRPVGEMQI